MPLLLPWSRAVNNKAKGVVPFASRPVQELNLDLREKLPVEKKSKKTQEHEYLFDVQLHQSGHHLYTRRSASYHRPPTMTFQRFLATRMVMAYF